jgi:hypothetical protein
MLLLIAALAIAGAASPARSASLEPGHDVARQAMIESGVPQPAPTALDSVPHPWPGVALSLSVVGTAAPILVMTSVGKTQSDAGVVLGILATEIVTPSAGHLYAGLTHRALVGMGVRAVGYGVVAAGAYSQGLWPGQVESSDFTYAVIVIGLGSAIMAGSALVDIIVVPYDVDRRNAEWLQKHATLGVRIAPDATPELAFALRF